MLCATVQIPWSLILVPLVAFRVRDRPDWVRLSVSLYTVCYSWFITYLHASKWGRGAVLSGGRFIVCPPHTCAGRLRHADKVCSDKPQLFHQNLVIARTTLVTIFLSLCKELAVSVAGGESARRLHNAAAALYLEEDKTDPSRFTPKTVWPCSRSGE